MVLQRPLFWLLTFIELSLLLANRYLLQDEHRVLSGLHGLPILEWDAAMVPMSLYTFFIVFFGSQAYQRYYMFYQHCTGMSGAVLEWMGMIRRHYGGHLDCEWNTARLMLAAHHLLFAGLDGYVGEPEWLIIRRNNLLSEAEVMALRMYGGNKVYLVLNWALDEVERRLETYFESKDDRGTGGHGRSKKFRQLDLLYTDFERAAFNFRTHANQIHSLLAAPVPQPFP